MQYPEPSSDSQGGPALRRAKQPPPIQTNFSTRSTTRLQRPRPVETIIYEKPPERVPLVSEAHHLKRRTSKGGLLSLFSRNKAAKNVTSEGQLHTFPEEEQDDARSVILKAAPSVRRVQSPAKSVIHNSPPPAIEAVKESTPGKLIRESTPSSITRVTSAKKERPVKNSKTWDPPPLFQAYPQSVKHANLSAPTLSADVILRMEKSRRNTKRKAHKSKPAADVVIEDSTPKDGEAEIEGEDQFKHKNSAPQIECNIKVFVLATSGFLLQYSGEGSHDRLPEKVMQLDKDSAAFASDAIPGKHWVLHISQASNEDGAIITARSRSMLSRFRFGTESRRSVASFLLVLDSPEDMNTWLVAVRREIEALGGKSYRPDVATQENKEEIIQQLREKPSRRYFIKRDPAQFSNGEASADVSWSDSVSVKSSGAAHSDTYSKSVRRQSVLPRNSLDAPSASYTSLSGDQALLDRLRESPRFSYASTGTRTLETSRGTSPTPSPIRTDFNADRSLVDDDRSLTPTVKDDPRRRSFHTLSPLNDERKSRDVHSAPKSPRPHSTSGSVSPVAPNFSVPTFSKRYSQIGKVSSLPSPPMSITDTIRRTSSSSADIPDPALRSRPESIVGELPSAMRTSPKPSRGRLPSVTPGPPPASHEFSPSSTDRPIPRRFSSLEYASGKLPFTSPHHQHQTPSPHPPPTTALPPPPPDTIAPILHNNFSRPSSAHRNHPPHKLRRPASIQVRSSEHPAPVALRTRASQNGIGTRAVSYEIGGERVGYTGLGKKGGRASYMGPPLAPPPSNPLPSLPPVTAGKENGWGGEREGRRSMSVKVS